MRSLILLLLVMLSTENIFSQQKIIENDFHPPLDIPMILSGNFAELRTGHFHSGIDIKTQGVTGKKVYAIDKGYVSRIKVQTNGYGKSVYINHPGGYTSVYAHLEDYNDKIGKYVKEYQYRNQVHEVDIYPSAGDLIIEKGEVIALSGNTGSSGGPHLHFEIREASTQKPLNVLQFGFNITDNVAPRLYSLFIYDISGEGKDRTVSGRKEYTLQGNGKSYSCSVPVQWNSKKPFAVGVETYDFLNNSPNRCGIYTLELFVNDELRFLFETDKFSFAETRYINAHMDFALKAETGRRTHDLFVHPNETLSMTNTAVNEGIITPGKEDSVSVRIVATDTYGNKSELSFRVNTAADPSGNDNDEDTEEKNAFHWYHANHFSNHLFKINLPKDALYENTDFSYRRIEREHSFYPWVHQVHNEAIPIHARSAMAISLQDIPDEFKPGLCVVKIDRRGKPEYVGGSIDEGWITASVREFGTYSLEADTTAPVLYPVNIGKNSNMQGHKRISFKVKDDLSGLAEYRAFIDNQWVLLEYDPKSSLLYYEIDQDRLESNSQHELEIYISDELGNSNMYHSSFYW